jgi:hypothetical protein
MQSKALDQYRCARWIPASMQRIDPPAGSMVGTDNSTIRADSSMKSFCCLVSDAAVRVEMARIRSFPADNSMALPANIVNHLSADNHLLPIPA